VIPVRVAEIRSLHHRHPSSPLHRGASVNCFRRTGRTPRSIRGVGETREDALVRTTAHPSYAGARV
jgi:hypothetical protein